MSSSNATVIVVLSAAAVAAGLIALARGTGASPTGQPTGDAGGHGGGEPVAVVPHRQSFGDDWTDLNGWGGSSSDPLTQNATTSTGPGPTGPGVDVDTVTVVDEPPGPGGPEPPTPPGGGGGPLDEFRAGVGDQLAPYNLGATLGFLGLTAGGAYAGRQLYRRFSPESVGPARSSGADLVDDAVPRKPAPEPAGPRAGASAADETAKAAATAADVARGGGRFLAGLRTFGRVAAKAAGPVGIAVDAGVSYGPTAASLAKGEISGLEAARRAARDTPGFVTLGAVQLADDREPRLGIPILTPIVEAFGGQFSIGGSPATSAPASSLRASTTTTSAQHLLPSASTAPVPPAAPAPPSPTPPAPTPAGVGAPQGAALPPPSLSPAEYRRVQGGYALA